MARTRSIRAGFEQRLLAQLRRGGVAAGQRLLVGFSGGPDSLALAAGLRRLAPLLDLDACLVHVDHGLRSCSAGEAAKCEALSRELGFEFVSVSLELGLAERAGAVGVEEQGRRERYLALRRAAEDWNTTTILLGHQANDQAETVLLHLFRGSGLEGLSGMSLVEQRPIPWWTDPVPGAAMYRIVRPLLIETREHIEKYLAELRLEPLVDETNNSLDFDRNWVRIRVLTAIEERWPAAIKSIARSVEASRLDVAYLDSVVRDITPSILTADRTLRTDALIESGTALAWRVIRDWLLEIGVEDLSMDVVARVYDLATRNDERAAVEAGSGKTIVKDRGTLTTLESLAVSKCRSIPMWLDLGEQPWSIELGCSRDDADAWVQAPDGVELQVRPVRAGDRWFGTRRSVFDDLRSADIHLHLRSRLLAVTADGAVLLIPAIYPTIRSDVTGESHKQVGVRWRRVDGRRRDSERTKESKGY